MRIAAAEILCDLRNGLHLRCAENAVGQPHAAHVARLRGGHIEQPVIAPAEIVFGLRRLACPRMAFEAGVGVQRIFAALPFFLIDKLAVGRCAILSEQGGGLGACGRAGRSCNGIAGRLHGCRACDEPLEPTLLLRDEIFRHAAPPE